MLNFFRILSNTSLFFWDIPKPSQSLIEQYEKKKLEFTNRLNKNISERLKRIESTIDGLQSAVLDKIGVYGSGLDSIKREMSMMQDSFGKVVNTLADKKENAQTHHIAHHENPVQRIEKRTTVVHKSQSKKHSKK